MIYRHSKKNIVKNILKIYCTLFRCLLKCEKWARRMENKKSTEETKGTQQRNYNSRDQAARGFLQE